MRKLKDYIIILIKRLAMGGADVVPGVSGGTIAFITGIYEELLDSINAINFKSLGLKGSLIDAARTQQRVDLVFSGVLMSSGLALLLVSTINLIAHLLFRGRPYLRKQ